MAADLLAAYPQSIAGLTLVPGANGRYEVTVNGETIFSKADTGRFPEPEEIEGLLQGRL
jgi:selenoprotein W-related protein